MGLALFVSKAASSSMFVSSFLKTFSCEHFRNTLPDYRENLFSYFEISEKLTNALPDETSRRMQDYVIN